MAAPASKARADAIEVRFMVRWLEANSVNGAPMPIQRHLPCFSFAALLLTVLAQACKPRQVAGSNDAGVPPIAASSAAATQRPTLPPEPPPADADLAGEVPALEAKLALDPAYQAVWTGPRADLNAFLTAVSEVFAYSGVIRPVTDHLRKAKLHDAMLKLAQISSRKTTVFPDDFLAKLKAHLTATKAEPQLGTWSPAVKGQTPHDYTALAAWLNRDDPTYLRERIGAKNDGPIGWNTYTIDPAKPPPRLYLVDEGKAFEWLSLLTPLTSDEKARVEQLRAEANVLKVPLRTLLAEYKDNELRGDAKFKGKIVQVSGTAGDVKKDLLGSAFVIVGTGAALEIPQVQCFFDEKNEKRIAALSKGDPITVRGRVEGLMMNVLMKDCELVR